MIIVVVVVVRLQSQQLRPSQEVRVWLLESSCYCCHFLLRKQADLLQGSRAITRPAKVRAVRGKLLYAGRYGNLEGAQQSL